MLHFTVADWVDCTVISRKVTSHKQVIIIGSKWSFFLIFCRPDLTDQQVLTPRESSGVEKRKGANIDISEQLESPHQFESSKFDQSIGIFGIFGILF